MLHGSEYDSGEIGGRNPSEEVDFGDQLVVVNGPHVDTTSCENAELERQPRVRSGASGTSRDVEDIAEEEDEIRSEKRRVLPSVLSLLLSSSQNSSFFVAVMLSGMGTGVIDTFLFIRYN